MKTIMLLSLAVATMSAALSPGLAMGASANPTVTVVNTTANPVPVTGSISLANAVLPVEVRNADPIPVVDTSAAGRVPVRFGPKFDGGLLVPIVPAGKVFIVTSLHLLLVDNVQVALTSGRCVLQVFDGTTSTGMALIALTTPSGLPETAWSANPLLALPLKAGEGLQVECSGAPFNSPQQATVTATGYYVPASQ